MKSVKNKHHILFIKKDISFLMKRYVWIVIMKKYSTENTMEMKTKMNKNKDKYNESSVHKVLEYMKATPDTSLKDMGLALHITPRFMRKLIRHMVTIGELKITENRLDYE